MPDEQQSPSIPPQSSSDGRTVWNALSAGVLWAKLPILLLGVIATLVMRLTFLLALAVCPFISDAVPLAALSMILGFLIGLLVWGILILGKRSAYRRWANRLLPPQTGKPADEGTNEMATPSASRKTNATMLLVALAVYVLFYGSIALVATFFPALALADLNADVSNARIVIESCVIFGGLIFVLILAIANRRPLPTIDDEG